MASSTLREKWAASTAQNARFTGSGTNDVPGVSADQRQYDEACWTAVRPVSGTPLWARPAEGGGRVAIPPWEPWPDTPRDPARFAAKLASGRKLAPAQMAREAEAPKPQAPQGQRQKSHAWRIAFDDPKKGAAMVRVRTAVEAGATKSAVNARAAVEAEAAGTGNASAAAPMHSVDPFAALRKRIALFFGFAYLLLFALASGLSVYMPLSADGRDEDAEDEGDTVERPTLHGTPSQTDYRPRPHRHPNPHAPGLHVRPDGSRYLIVPLNFAGAAA